MIRPLIFVALIGISLSIAAIFFKLITASACIGLLIALFGLGGVSFVLYGQAGNAKWPVVAVFAAYALILAFGVAYHQTFSSLKVGPGGVEAAFQEAKDDFTKFVENEIRGQRNNVAELTRQLTEQKEAAQEIFKEQEKSINDLTSQLKELRQAAEDSLARLRPRVLSSQQQQMLSGSLKLLRDGQAEVWILPNSPSEVARFAGQLLLSIQRASWKTNSSVKIQPMPDFVSIPLCIIVKDKQKPPRSASELQRAMQEIGFRVPIFSEGVEPILSIDRVILFVGAREY